MEGNVVDMLIEKIKAIKDINDARPHDAQGYEINDIITDALAIPLRNCDVGTAEEQNERFKNFCLSYYEPCNIDGECWKCPLFKTKTRCPIAWAQMPYETQEGGVK